MPSLCHFLNKRADNRDACDESEASLASRYLLGGLEVHLSPGRMLVQGGKSIVRPGEMRWLDALSRSDCFLSPFLFCNFATDMYDQNRVCCTLLYSSTYYSSLTF